MFKHEVELTDDVAFNRVAEMHEWLENPAVVQGYEIVYPPGGFGSFGHREPDAVRFQHATDAVLFHMHFRGVLRDLP